MLTNQHTQTAINQYKQIFLSNFTDETQESFDYLVNEIVRNHNVYLSLDEQNDVQLGLVVIEKTIDSHHQVLKAGLIYGVVASQKAKGTKIVARLLPHFIDELKQQYDIVLIESNHWPIYKEIGLLQVNQYNIYDLVNIPSHNLSDIQINNINEHVIKRCLDLYEKHLHNFNIKTYLKHDINSMTNFIKLNMLSGDVLLLTDHAYALWNETDNKIYSVAFDSIVGFKQLLEYLRPGCQVQLNESFATLNIDSLKLNRTFIKTKQVIGTNKIHDLLFNEIN